MSKQSLLLVDGDTRSLRVLEVSLRKAGFSVTPAVSVEDALEKLEVAHPDLIISETKFATELDGFELRRRLRGAPDWAEIPFIFLTAETAIENKIKGLELGVDDYLTKPIYIKEIVTRINILLQKRQRQFLDLRKDGTRFAGRVADMPVVDVIQTIEVSRKSGVIQFSGGPSRQAAIYFRDGKVIDAEAGTLQGEDAVYRLLTWNDGEFEVEFRTVRRRDVIEMSSQGLLMEGMRRLDEWSRLLEQLPPLSHRFEIDAGELSTRLGEVPDDNNRILRLFDSKRTLLEVIDASDFGDLECLQAVSRLYFEGLLLDLDPAVRPPRDTGKPAPVQADEQSSSPIQAAASGPIDLMGLEKRASQPEIADSTTAKPTPAPLDNTAPVEAADVMSSQPLVSPSELAAEMPRRRRDSAQAIDEHDVLGEEEVRSPLAGGYRPSSLRLIDEAVAAAQLIEPSLFADDELAALGIPRATAQQVAAARSEPSSTPPPQPAPKAGVTMGWDAVGAPTEATEAPAVVAAPKSVTTGWDAVADPTEAPATAAAADEDPRAVAIARLKEELGHSDPRIEPAVDSPSTKNGANGHAPLARTKTKPPPLPLPPSINAKQLEEAEMLDSNLLTSGEIRVPSDAELADAPLLESDLLTSGEIKIPTEAALGGGPPPVPKEKAVDLMAKLDEISAEVDAPAAKVEEPVVKVESTAKVEEPTAKVETPVVAKAADDDSGGVPTAIEPEVDGGDLADEGPTVPSRKRAPSRPDDSQGVKMIGSAGRDRAEAAGELRPPHFKTNETATQRELVTIMPRRKTGEVAQLNPEDVSTLDSKGQAKAKAIVEAVDAAEAAKAKAAEDAPEAEAEAKPARTETKPEVKPAAKPALEGPPRRVSVEGGVVVPQRGPGRAATILIAAASILAGAAVFSYCRKQKTTTPVAVTQQDAGERLARIEDAAEYNGFGVDGGEAAPPDAAKVALDRPDAGVRADAAVAVVRPDAASVAVAPNDAGAAAGPTAAGLATKGRAALAEGEPAVALDLFDQSLKLKKDKRTYVDRGRALHNLGKTDEAVASIDEAIKMSDTYAPAYEQKGLILWSAQRYGDARPALEMYLQLQPDGPKAETIRKMLDEPR